MKRKCPAEELPLDELFRSPWKCEAAEATYENFSRLQVEAIRKGRTLVEVLKEQLH